MKFFTAQLVRFEHEAQCLSLGFFDDEFDPIDFLLLSRSHASTEILLLINDNDREFSHAIEKVELRDDDLWLWIHPDAIDALDYRKIHVQIVAPSPDLAKQLQQFFADSEVLLQLAAH